VHYVTPVLQLAAADSSADQYLQVTYVRPPCAVMSPIRAGRASNNQHGTGTLPTARPWAHRSQRDCVRHTSNHSTYGKRTVMLAAAKRGTVALRNARAMHEPWGVPAKAPSMLP
jgi:hypothetical protein